MGRPKLVDDDKILQAARKEFSAKGIQGSTRAIAKTARVSEATLFQRYRTKADLFFAAMVPPPIDVQALFDRPSTRSPLRQLEDIALGMLNYFRSIVPIWLPLVTHPSFDYQRFLRDHPDAGMPRLQRALMAYLTKQRRAGCLVDRQVQSSAITLVALTHGFAVFEAMGAHDAEFFDKEVRDSVRNLWHGIAPRR